MKRYPKYVTLNKIALEYSGDGEYFRLAGLWSVKSKWKDGKLFSEENSVHRQLNNVELIECNYKYWKQDNGSKYVKQG